MLGQQLRTFSIGFCYAGNPDLEGDEFRYSDAVARKFGTRHTRIRIDAGEVVPAVGETLAAMTEPMGNHDVAAFFLLCREVCRQVKVVRGRWRRVPELRLVRSLLRGARVPAGARAQ